MTVNGVAQTVAFESTGGDNVIWSSTLHCGLKAGSGNVVTIEGVNGGWAANVDRLMVPSS